MFQKQRNEILTVIHFSENLLLQETEAESFLFLQFFNCIAIYLILHKENT